MSRRNQSKKQRQARRERISTEMARAFAPLPPGTSSGRIGPVTFTARGGTSFTLVPVGPVVHFNPDAPNPEQHLLEQVVGEMLRQAGQAQSSREDEN